MKDSVYVISLPQSFGGGEVFLVRLAELLKNQSKLIVVSPELPELQRGVEAANGRFIMLHGSGGAAIRWALIKWLWVNRREFKGKTSAFVLNGRGAIYFAPFIRLITRLSPVAICHTELGFEKRKLKDLLYGAALNFTRCAITVSDAVKAQHSERWPLRVISIPNWIDDSEFIHRSVPSVARSSVTQIAVVGRLVESKGIQTLAHVFATTNGIESNFYGDGPLRGSLENIALTTPSIKFHGHVDNLSARLPHHSILVSGSFSESFSYSVAEGIHAGLLCVVSDIAAHRELLGPEYPEVLYFAPGNVDDLRQALKAALDLLHASGGHPAKKAVRQAYLRMRARNGPEQARRAYCKVLLGIPSSPN